jgi:DNA-binding SARP family transcriptional activator
VPASPALRIELFGGFHLLVDGRADARLPSARQQEVIAYLLLHARNTPIQRQRVAAALWPESTDAQALTNLRRELHHLRDAFPRIDGLIDAGSRTLLWGGSARTAVDLIEFERAVERGLDSDRPALQDAARVYIGDLLPGCTSEWIEPDRERLRQRAQQALTRLVAQLEQERAFGDAIERLQQLLRLDPLDEPAWCALMRCHARRGERATALHLYQQCAALLKKELGVQPSAATRMTYREVLDLDAAASVTPPAPRSAAYPLVGRQTEWQSLLTAWAAAVESRPRLLLIRGEAGIGKTRLAEELIDWCGLQGTHTATARCYAGEGRLAYAPIVTWLKSQPLHTTLLRLDAYWLTDVARLRPELLAARPEVPRPDPQLESWQRVRFFDAIAQAFRSTAPLVLVIDDLQWADGDTIEWLQYFVRSLGETPCLVVGTARADEEQDNPPLVRMLGRLDRDDMLTAISLGPLDRAATVQLAGAVAERPLDEDDAARTYRETEGHPLFIVERGRMEAASHAGTPAEPPTPLVQSVLAARLTLLSDEARAAAEVASAVGRDFRFDLLAQASDLEEDVLVRALDELWRRQIVRVHDEERWDFSHDRIREVAYSGIGPARRRLIHRRIAQGMELLFADRLDEVSASIAAHLDAGGQPAKAVPFLERAAAVATRVSANEEAIRRLNHALTLLASLPPGRDRDHRELAIRSTLSVSLNSARGYAAPEVEDNLNRVLTLSRDDGRGIVPVRWLWVAFTMRFMLGDLKGSREASEEALARTESDPSCRCEAHHAMGGLLQVAGELETARAHFEASLGAYDEAHPQRSALGSDLGVFGLAWYSHVLWLLGDERAAVSHADQAIALARRLDHMYSQTLAFAYAAMLHQMRRDARRVLDSAEAALAMCDRYGFAYYGEWAQALIGWARGQQQPDAGIATIESAIDRLDAIRARARRPYFLSLLAETCSLARRVDRATAILDRAIAVANDHGEVCWLPGLYLQKSELESASQRVVTINRALELARAQHNRALEQRILGTLSRTL